MASTQPSFGEEPTPTATHPLSHRVPHARCHTKRLPRARQSRRVRAKRAAVAAVVSPSAAVCRRGQRHGVTSVSQDADPDAGQESGEDSGHDSNSDALSQPSQPSPSKPKDMHASLRARASLHSAFPLPHAHHTCFEPASASHNSLRRSQPLPHPQARKAPCHTPHVMCASKQGSEVACSTHTPRSCTSDVALHSVDPRCRQNARMPVCLVLATVFEAGNQPDYDRLTCLQRMLPSMRVMSASLFVSCDPVARTRHLSTHFDTYRGWKSIVALAPPVLVLDYFFSPVNYFERVYGARTWFEDPRCLRAWQRAGGKVLVLPVNQRRWGVNALDLLAEHPQLSWVPLAAHQVPWVRASLEVDASGAHRKTHATNFCTYVQHQHTAACTSGGAHAEGGATLGGRGRKRKRCSLSLTACSGSDGAPSGASAGARPPSFVAVTPSWDWTVEDVLHVLDGRLEADTTVHKLQGL